MSFFDRDRMTTFGRRITDPEMWRREGELWGQIGQIGKGVFDIFNPFDKKPFPWEVQQTPFPQSVFAPREWQGGRPGEPEGPAQLPPPPRFLDNSPFAPMEEATFRWQGQEQIRMAQTDRLFAMLDYYGNNLPEFMIDDLFLKYRLDAPDVTAEDVQSALQEVIRSFSQFATRTETGRLQMQQAVGQGAMTGEQAFGAGTPWEAWQRAQVADINQAVSRAAFPQAMQDPLIQKTLNQARAMGIDTSDAEAALAQSIKGTGWTDENLGAALHPLMLSVRARQQSAMNAMSATFAKEFPDAYKRYLRETGAGAPVEGGVSGLRPGFEWGAGLSEAAYRASVAAGGEVAPIEFEGGAEQPPEYGFLNWAMGQDWFKQERVQWETEQWSRYGDVYNAYLDYLNRGGDLTFEEFRKESPEIQAALQLRQKAETERVTRRAPSRWETAKQTA